MPIYDKIIQFRRGNSAKNQSLTGADGEITIDKTKKTIVVHDGVTAGGSPLATESNIEYGLSGKVDKEAGKQLSTEDYTTAEKSKLAGIESGATADQTKEDIDLLGIDAATVNGLTVETAVPAGAVFTDTIYDDSTTTKQGNTFNGANQLLQLDASGKLPAVDGSQLTGVSSVGSIDDLTDVDTTTVSPVSGDVLVWNGTNWIPGEAASSEASMEVFEFTATEGQTTFNVAYTAGNIEVMLNGIELASTDYIATNETSVVLNMGATVGDIVTVRAFNSFSVANVYSKAEVYTKNEVDTVLSSKAEINDTTSSTTQAYSSQKTEDELALKLSLSGGTMTGAITSLRETSVAMVDNNIDLALGNVFIKTITTATTLTVSNVPTSGNVGFFILELTNAASSTITWFSGVKWSGGTAPTLTASGKDILSFYTRDGGTTWNTVAIQKDVK